MTENKSSGLITILVLVIFYLLFFHQQKYEGLTASEWFDEYSDAESKLSDLEEQLYSYEYALDEANSNIDEAKYYAWESYDEMGEALDTLETVEP